MQIIWKIWKSGGWVLLRWLWFSFILALLSIPIRMLLRKSGLMDLPYQALFPLLLGGYILIGPLVMYAVSELTGEFVAPRITRKKLRAIQQGFAAEDIRFPRN